MEKVVARSYCSSANLGSGFDSFGLCLNAFYTDVEISKLTNSSSGNRQWSIIDNNSTDGDLITYMTKYVSSVFGIADKLSVRVNSTIPIGKGLGSSGALEVGICKAISFLYDIQVSDKELIQISSKGEKFISGSDHKDNVAASTTGNLSIVHSDSPLIFSSVKVSGKISFLLIVPEIQESDKTKQNRALLPKTVHFRDSLFNLRYSNSILIGLQTGSEELIKFGCNDNIVEPARSKKYSFFYEIREICLKNGALGATLSGAGPSIIVFYRSGESTEKIERYVAEYFSGKNIKVKLIQSSTGEGVKVEFR